MNRFESKLRELEERDTLRRIPGESEGLIDLVSNDYLGLGAREQEFHDDFFRLYPGVRFTSGASRLLSRRQKFHNMLEGELENLYGKSVLLFNSGYHANSGIIGALGRPETLFLVDTLMHASGRDGLMLAERHRHAGVRYFPHNDIEALESMIAEERRRQPDVEIIVVTESVFSMDGDLAPLEKIVELKGRYPGIIIYLDEAHGFGVRGRRGLGLAEETGLTDSVDIIVGTLGKAAASEGAFVATTREIRDFLVNRARSFIFSTALAPINAAWSHFMLTKLVDMAEERLYLHRLAVEFGKLIGIEAESQILPYVVGSASKAVELAARLREGGFDVLPIRRPTVPPGGERLRFSLNATLNLTQLSPLPTLLHSI